MAIATHASGTVRAPFRARLSIYRYLNEKNALQISIAAACLAAVGDAATTAEVAFTLLYLIPIAITVWFRGIRAGAIVVALCFCFSTFTDLIIGPHSRSVVVTAWNLAAELALFSLYAVTISRLRSRMDMEMSLRMSALGELRHAERLNTIGKLASGVAHELGTPLNVIMGNAELISTEKLDLAGARASARVIEAQAERASTIIRHMLDFARRSGTETKPADMLALCEETAALLRALARKTGVEIVVVGTAAQAAVNRSEIQQVLTNLVSNGIHAMPEGGKLTIEVSTAKGSMGEGPPVDQVIVSVEDTGTGIAPEILPHIFDPFFTTKAVGEGTGLGLSVAFGIVRDHGGIIRVASTLGEGTRFRIYLPT